jgi:hypothetical protein
VKQGEGRDLARSSEDWLAWLTRELGRRQGPPRLRLLALWDVLEEWFATEDFAGSEVAAAVAAAPDGRGQATRAALARHRLAVRRLLEELATAAGARDAAVLAAQLQVLVEGAIVGALIDRHPGVARHGRELTEMALGSPRT